MEYEHEYTPTEPQTDEVWVMDGKGKMIRLEVEDDVADD
jgi:hypothetical protein